MNAIGTISDKLRSGPMVPFKQNHTNTNSLPAEIKPRFYMEIHSEKWGASSDGHYLSPETGGRTERVWPASKHQIQPMGVENEQAG